MRKIWIGGAWPYANGDLHLGHIAGLITGDVIAKYHRLSGDDVCYVSGTDCHGSPIAIKAKRHNTLPNNIVEHYHRRFKKDFEFLRFDYDYYGKTTDNDHKALVQEIFSALYDEGKIALTDQEQYYCHTCKLHLADRFLRGDCPYCGRSTRSGQCEHCNRFVEGENLSNIQCSLCADQPEIINVNQATLKLSDFEDLIKGYLDNHPEWRVNVRNTTSRYLSEGLKDKVITRSLKWGIGVPLEGFENQSVYVWFDAVIGYLSATYQWAKEKNKDPEDYLYHADKSYFVHGKDNIPFHTLIYPVIQEYDQKLKLVDHVFASEHLTFGGSKISTSSGHAPWVRNYRQYNADSLRLFMIINGPEKQDADFNQHEFERKHHHFLVDVLGNYYHRTLKFHQRFLGSKVVTSQLSEEAKSKLSEGFDKVSTLIEKGELKHGLYTAFEVVKWANKYYDKLAPWLSRKDNIETCYKDVGELLTIAINISVLLSPFLPSQGEYISSIFNVKLLKYCVQDEVFETEISEINPLYKRLIGNEQ